jgi:N4-bis(aminopropyl)spermidine synthase
MINYIEAAGSRVKLEEGNLVIEKLLLSCYFKPGIATKELARRTLLPVPVATAIKKELMRAGALIQKSGVHCTAEAKEWIEEARGFSGLDKALYLQIMDSNMDDLRSQPEMVEILQKLEDIFMQRPQVNVQIDQSKCTPETSLRRAILCLRHHSLIGKRILCVGDDDLVSISLGLLLQCLFPDARRQQAQIDVVDLDERFLRQIEEIAAREKLPVQCRHLDLREPLPLDLHLQYDCFFTDPPYTLQGMSLFVSRGIAALKKMKGLPIFLSFAHKSPDFMLAMHREFVRMGLTVHTTLPHFNEYEGAEMIANRSQMIVLKTTGLTNPEITDAFADALYTGEVKRTLRTYRCKQCDHAIHVGIQGDVATIEELKNQGCPACKHDIFQLVEKKHI